MEANLNQGLIVRANGGSKSNKMHGGCPARYTRADTDPARTSARTRQRRRGNRHDCPMRVFFVQVSYDCSRSTLAISSPPRALGHVHADPFRSRFGVFTFHPAGEPRLTRSVYSLVTPSCRPMIVDASRLAVPRRLKIPIRITPSTCTPP